MSREGVDEDDAPSGDIGWKFAIPVPGNRLKLNCKLCGREINGGITRLKQHLAHMKGQVRGCPNVSTEIREQMMNHLRGSKAKKIDKRKQDEERADFIRSQQYGGGEVEGFVVSSDDSDPEMTMAVNMSRYEQREKEERDRLKSKSGYDAGGSSRGGGSKVGFPSGTQRSVSMKELRDRGKKWFDPTTPEAKLAAMDVNLHRSKGSKQAKYSSTIMKTLRKKLGKAVSQFVLFGKHSANVVLNPWFEPMLDVAREVGKGVKPPTPYEINEVYLPEEYNDLKKWIESHKPVWRERGVTLMCDGWTGPTKKHIINFLVYSNRGTVFHKSIDATDVRSRTGEYYFQLMDKVVDEIGEEYIVQIITDNEAAMKAAGKLLMRKRPHLYWTGCAAHCIDLILEDIGKRSSVEKVLEDAKIITSFIYNYTWVVDFMKRFTNNRELLRPVITRFATNFITLESIVRHKKALEEMFRSNEWRESKWAKLPKAKEVKKIIFNKNFWSKAGDILKVQEPLVKVLRLVDGDLKPTMGFIYEAMDRAKKAIQRDSRYYIDFHKIIDKRWDFQLHHDLHAAGYFLNPQFQYGEALINSRQVMDGLKKVIQRLEPSIDNQIKAINQILTFRDKLDSFGLELAQRAVLQTNPAEWWIHYGTSCPELQQIAVRVLSQTTSSSNCERNWSTFSLIHTKTRNRLKSQKLNKLVYVYYNMRLKIRNATRRSQQEIEESFNPINLDYIFDEDDPLSPWLQERENPVLDGQDNSEWLDVDDQNDETHVNLVPSGSGSSGGGGVSSAGASLSPPTSGSDGDRGGPVGGYVQYEGRGGDSSSPYQGEIGSHGFHGNEDTTAPIHDLHNWGGTRRRTRRPTGDNSNSRNLENRFGELEVSGYTGDSSQTPPTYSYPPQFSYYPPPPQYYYPPPQSHYFPLSSAPPFLPPQGYFVTPVPQGFFPQQGESSGSTNFEMGASNSNTSNYFGHALHEQANNDDMDVDGIIPPRHSTMW